MITTNTTTAITITTLPPPRPPPLTNVVIAVLSYEILARILRHLGIPLLIFSKAAEDNI